MCVGARDGLFLLDHVDVSRFKCQKCQKEQTLFSSSLLLPSLLFGEWEGKGIKEYWVVSPELLEKTQVHESITQAWCDYPNKNTSGGCTWFKHTLE